MVWKASTYPNDFNRVQKFGEETNLNLKFSPGRQMLYTDHTAVQPAHTHTKTHTGHEVMALMCYTDASHHLPLMTGQTGLSSRGVLSPSGCLLLHHVRQEHTSNGTG